jgi:hypothetical protein
MRWLGDILETVYAVILAIGLIGGVWGAVYFLFGSNGLITKFFHTVLVGDHGASSLLAAMAALLTALAMIHWLPRMQSSRPASALLGTLVVSGYAFLLRAFSVGI